MIDLAQARAMPTMALDKELLPLALPDEVVLVTRRWMEAALAEIEAGREARMKMAVVELGRAGV